MASTNSSSGSTATRTLGRNRPWVRTVTGLLPAGGSSRVGAWSPAWSSSRRPSDRSCRQVARLQSVEQEPRLQPRDWSTTRIASLSRPRRDGSGHVFRSRSCRRAAGAGSTSSWRPDRLGCERRMHEAMRSETPNDEYDPERAMSLRYPTGWRRHRHPVNIRHDGAGRTFGERLADGLTASVGSWPFILTQSSCWSRGSSQTGSSSGTGSATSRSTRIRSSCST